MLIKSPNGVAYHTTHDGSETVCGRDCSEWPVENQDVLATLTLRLCQRCGVEKVAEVVSSVELIESNELDEDTLEELEGRVSANDSDDSPDVGYGVPI